MDALHKGEAPNSICSAGKHGVDYVRKQHKTLNNINTNYLTIC